AEPGRNVLPEDALRAVVVLGRLEHDLSLLHAPTGEGACGLVDVLLRVATVHAERVKLEQLARVVLVRHALLARSAVEVEEHRARGDRRAHEIAYGSERVLSNRAIECRGESDDIALSDIDVEVVGPEADHHLEEMALAVHGAEKGVAHELFAEHAIVELVC